MTRFRTLLGQFAASRRGGTAIEYSIIASGIAVAIAGTIVATGTSVESLWTTVKDALG